MSMLLYKVYSNIVLMIKIFDSWVRGRLVHCPASFKPPTATDAKAPTPAPTAPPTAAPVRTIEGEPGLQSRGVKRGLSTVQAAWRGVVVCSVATMAWLQCGDSVAGRSGVQCGVVRCGMTYNIRGMAYSRQRGAAHCDRVVWVS